MYTSTATTTATATVVTNGTGGTINATRGTV